MNSLRLTSSEKHLFNPDIINNNFIKNKVLKLSANNLITNEINKDLNDNDREQNQQNEIKPLSNKNIIINKPTHFRRVNKKRKTSINESKKKKKSFSKIKLNPVFQRNPNRKLSLTSTKIFSELVRKTIIKQQNMEEKFNSVIKCLQIDLTLRTKEDLNLIKNFIKENKIVKNIVHHRINDEIENENLFQALSQELEYRYLENKETLFSISEKPDNIYLIIKGRVELYEFIEYRTDMNLYKYMKYIYTSYNTINQKDKAEKFKLKKIIEKNKDVIEISLKDIPFFIVLLIKNKCENIIENNRYNYIYSGDLEKMIIDCQNDPLIHLENFNYDKKKTNELYIQLIIKELYSKLPEISQELIDKYKYKLANQGDELLYNIKRYNLKKVDELNNGDFLGEETLDDNYIRKYTVISIEETHLASIDYDIFLDIINSYKIKITEKEAKVLKDSFYFRKIRLQYFIKNYFSDFSYQELTYGNNILSQNQPLKYLYFLKDGIIEVYCNKSIIELIDLIKILCKKLKNKSEEIKKKLFSLNNKLFIFGRINKNFIIKRPTRLLVMMNTDILGIESYICGIPYFYNCRIISEKAKFYTIPLNKIDKLLTDIKDTREYIMNDAYKRLEILSKRIIKIINNRIFHVNKSYGKNLKLKIKLNIKTDEKLKNALISRKKINELLYNNSSEIKDKEKRKSSSNIFHLTYTTPENIRKKQLEFSNFFKTEKIKQNNFSKTYYLNKTNNILSFKNIGKDKKNFKSKIVNSFKYNKTGFTLSKKVFEPKDLIQKIIDNVGGIRRKNKNVYSIKTEIKILSNFNKTLESELLLSKLKKHQKKTSRDESKISDIDNKFRKKAKTIIIHPKPMNLNDKSSSRTISLDKDSGNNNLTLSSNINRKDYKRRTSEDLNKKFSEKMLDINLNLFKKDKNILYLLKKNDFQSSTSTQKSLNLFNNNEKNQSLEPYKFKGNKYNVTYRDKYKKKIYKLIQEKIKKPNFFIE